LGTSLLAAAGELAAQDDAAVGEGELAADLGVFVPAGLVEGRGDELLAELGFVERFLVHHFPLACEQLAQARVEGFGGREQRDSGEGNANILEAHSRRRRVGCRAKMASSATTDVALLFELASPATT